MKRAWNVWYRSKEHTSNVLVVAEKAETVIKVVSRLGTITQMTSADYEDVICTSGEEIQQHAAA